MEVTVSSIVASIGLVTLLTCAWRVVNWVWLKPKQLEKCLREQGLKGNPYKLLYGDTKEIISTMRAAKSKSMDASSDDIVPHLLPFHHQCVNLHGKHYFQWMGPTPRVTITDPKLIKEIMFNYQAFQKPKPNPLGKLLVRGLGSYEGEKWAKHRNLINPAFHLEKLKLMVPAMYSSCSEMISKWEVLVSTKGSCEVDIWPYLDNLTGDVISRTAFGSNYEEGKRIFQLQKEQTDLTIQLLRSFYIPGWRFLPTKTNKRMKAIYHEVGALLRNIIINKRAQTMKGEDGDDDLLGILLKTNLKDVQEQGNKKNITLTIEEVIDECKLFYIAGQETTSALLLWTMILLSKHQKWQTQAREEVLAVFGDNKPDYDGLNQLKTITMILYEVLRLYSPLAFLIRTIPKKARLGELVLPPGLDIFVPMIAIHHDREIWGEDATEFKPERFSEGIKNATKGQATFFPFGGGPRICIGQNFAMVEAKVALALILRHFSFQLSPSYVHAPSQVFTLQPQHGAHLVLQKI